MYVPMVRYYMSKGRAMRTADAVEQLRAELLQDLQFIKVNYQKNRHMTERIRKSGSYDEYGY